MTLPLLSPDWYRVSYLRPRTRAGLRVTRQTVRGEAWMIVTDPVSGRHHRFNLLAWQLVASCDGRRTLDEVWGTLVDAAGDAAPTQGEAIEILSSAFAGHLLLGDIPPDAAAVVRLQARRRGRSRREAINPLAFRIPLWDPDAFLARHLPLVAWLFTPAMLRTVALLIGLSMALLLAQADRFAIDAQQLLGDTRGLLLVWFAYPFVKALHELAHGFAVKRYGGEVHSMGITLLMLTPVPFVDASASAAFVDKRQRALVAAAGIGVELLLAGAALALWSVLEPGLLRELATAVVVIGGLSTLLVNGNPLLRFDGYHVLCDLAEIPNLAQRSRNYWLHQLRRGLLGMTHGPFPGLAQGERPWLIAYAPLAWVLRTAMLAVLAVFLARAWPWAAVLLALAALWLGLLGPLTKAVAWTLRAPQLAHRRPRALAVVLCAFGLAGAVAFALPLPQRSHAPGVVWLPDEAQVRLQVGGFVDDFLVRDGEVVAAGASLARLSNPPLVAELARARAELRQAEVEQAELRDQDPLAAAQAGDRVAQLHTEVAALEGRVDALLVRARAGGRVSFDVHRDLVGMFLPQGHLLAQVVPDDAPLVRALVDNSDIGLVRARTESARVHLASGGPSLPAQLAAAVPLATATLPSAALGTSGGGSIPTDPIDSAGRTAREARFQVDVRLPADARPPIGARVLVTFDHGDASGADWLVRLVRHAFLRHLSA